MRRITLGFTTLGVALALALAGCGGGGDGANAVSIKALKTAAATTARAESVSFTIDQRIDFFGKPFTMHAEGVSSGDGTRARVTTTNPLGGTFELRLIDGVAYIGLGDSPLAGLLPAGTRWVRLDLGELVNGQGSVIGGLLDPAQRSTPQSGLDLLKGLSGDVETVGDDTVAGRHATHSHASIDFSKVGNLPGLDDDARAKLGSVPVDVWIDDRDRVVKVQTTIDASMVGVPGVEGSVSMTMEVTEFGVPIDVEPPPADEVFEFDDLGDGRTI
ncbi:MAG: hypothetical protein WD271_14665 [Acidimicrobiia bacterium]